MDYIVAKQREQLAFDASHAKEISNEAWIDPTLWRQYDGKTGRTLYKSFSDEELLDILRDAAKRLGRPPSQHEVFCVYRMYIRQRFTNWPTALRAAGLKEQKRNAKRETQ